jgi:hypothetical protein
LQPGFFLGFVVKSGKDTIEDGDVRVIALEEEVVRVTIRIRMHEDRAARRFIAAGAADFLVIRFETSW